MKCGCNSAVWLGAVRHLISIRLNALEFHFIWFGVRQGIMEWRQMSRRHSMKRLHSNLLRLNGWKTNKSECIWNPYITCICIQPTGYWPAFHVHAVGLADEERCDCCCMYIVFIELTNFFNTRAVGVSFSIPVSSLYFICTFHCVAHWACFILFAKRWNLILTTGSNKVCART